MPVLSILACRMLEDELASFLSADREVRELLLLDGKDSLSLSAKLKAKNRPHLLLSQEEIALRLRVRGRKAGKAGIFAPNTSRRAEELVVVVRPLALGLHSDLDRLRNAAYDGIQSLSPFSDRILIFYGKCGGFLANLERDLPGLTCPISLLADESGARIEDCIALALGGNEFYDRALAEHQDAALFMTPMWASNWRVMGQEDADPGKGRDLGATIRASGMKKVVRIDTGLRFEPGFDEKVNEFATNFGLQRIDMPGGTALAKGCYERAKASLGAGRHECTGPGARRNGLFRCLQELLRAVCRMM
ncbi:MAG TPA: DUF1638 domain-containing protein [Methanothrix sp.]|nr:DUF1638 domain-containing protein [Methanothrix sp.]